MKNLRTFEGFLDRFRDEKAGLDLIPEPEETEIKGEKIERGKDLSDLTYRIIRDSESEIDLFIEHNYIEFIDINDNKVICSFSIVPEPGQTVNMDGDILSDDEAEETDQTLLYYDVNGNYLEVFNNESTDRGLVEFSFSIRDAEDVTEVFDDV